MFLQISVTVPTVPYITEHHSEEQRKAMPYITEHHRYNGRALDARSRGGTSARYAMLCDGTPACSIDPLHLHLAAAFTYSDWSSLILHVKEKKQVDWSSLILHCDGKQLIVISF